LRASRLRATMATFPDGQFRRQTRHERTSR
jgi:hypothetical protein